MNARNVMTKDVISVKPGASITEVAKLLAAHRVSAVPVVNTDGAPIGMVSEGDLMARDGEDRDARRDWWLTLLAEGEELHSDFLATLTKAGRTVADVMTSPVVTVTEDAEINEIAKLLVTHRIKRVPVITKGRVAGIVSRADLVRALAQEPSATQEPAPQEPARRGGLFAEAVAAIDHRFGELLHHRAAALPAGPSAGSPPDDTHLSVGDFRHLVADHEEEKAAQQLERQRQVAERRRERIAELINRHISEKDWRSLVHKARQAAESGEKQFMLLRFPSGLCSDGGQAINSARPDWPNSLRGEAADIYRRWEHDLRPHGFALAASVLEFPGGMPGDVGMFLVWGT
jgi:CBS domain-containing protein